MLKKLISPVVFLISMLISSIPADEKVNKNAVAVLPLEVINISENDGVLMAKEISEGLSSIPDIDVIPFEKALENSRNAGINKDTSCRNRVCLLNVGKSLYADIAFMGSFYKIDNKITLSVAVVNCRNNATLWTKDYSGDGQVSDFIKKTSYEAVYDTRKSIWSGEEIQKTQTPKVEETTSKNESTDIDEPKTAPVIIDNYDNESDNDNDEDEDEDEDRDRDDYRENVIFDNGAVKNFTLGLNYRYVINGYEDKDGESESQMGGEVFVLYPTSKSSHVRLKFSLPMTTSGEFLENSTYREDRDFLFSLDHEWCMRNVGLTVGAAYMYFREFDKMNYSNLYHYDSHSRMNWIFGVRGGKPNKGFRGRICFPMTFNTDKALYFEYSAFGQFGNDRMKLGLGLQGAYKAQRSLDRDTLSTYSEDYDDVSELYFAAPCAKVAFMIGSYNVISLGIDFMGLITPDIYENEADWTPNVFVGYTFSVGKISAVDSYDGRF